MSTKILVEQLRELASDDTKRSKAARLRDVIDEVEATLAAGVTRADVVRKLSENGLEMTLAAFNSELQKTRKKRRELALSGIAPEPALPAEREMKGNGQGSGPAEAIESDGLAGLSQKEQERIRRERYTDQYFNTIPNRFIKLIKKDGDK